MNDKERELHLEENIKRAKEAETILNNALFLEALTAIRAELYENFTKTKFKDDEERKEIWRKQQSIDWLEKYFVNISNTGKLSMQELGKISRIKKVIGL